MTEQRQRRGSWMKYQTEEGYEYYYDEDTRNSQWERPQEYYSDEEMRTGGDETVETVGNGENDGKYENYEGYSNGYSEGITTNEIVLEDPQYSTEQSYQGYEYYSYQTPASGQGEQENYPQEYGTSTTYTSTEQYSESYVEDTFEFEYNPNSPLFEELMRLTLFQPLTTIEKTYLRSGHWCKISCRKLEVLQMCLENYGTEDEWKYIFSYEDWIAVRYLMKFMHPSAHPVLQDAAARCLAYAHMPYPKIWVDYLHAMDKPSPIHMYRVTYMAVERIKVLSDMPPEEKPSVPYAGFDIRDIKDYNLENLEEYNVSGEGSKVQYDMVGATDVATTIAVWLLLLFEIFRSPSRLIGDDFRRRRIALLGMGSKSMTTASSSGGESDQMSTTENFLEMVSDLLSLSNKLKESSYLLCVKVVAAINWQIPTKDLVGSTEIAEICAKLQFGEADSNVNVSEGLLHLLNDIGYPNHKLPETLPTLQLCYDLITTPEYEGFFYVNDLKVMIEVIIRELSNLPWDEESWSLQKYEDDLLIASSNRGELIIYDGLNGPMEGVASDVVPHNELLRQMYLKLTTALMNWTTWPTLENYYMKADLDRVLQWWLDNGLVCCPTTVELVSTVLDKRLGSV